jgi:hypothetical protein
MFNLVLLPIIGYITLNLSLGTLYVFKVILVLKSVIHTIISW